MKAALARETRRPGRKEPERSRDKPWRPEEEARERPATPGRGQGGQEGAKEAIEDLQAH